MWKTAIGLLLVASLSGLIAGLTVVLNLLKQKLKMPVLYEDTTVLHFGVHKNKRLIDIPESWFKWFWGENVAQYRDEPLHMSASDIGLMSYIEESFNVEKW